MPPPLSKAFSSPVLGEPISTKSSHTCTCKSFTAGVDGRMPQSFSGRTCEVLRSHSSRVRRKTSVSEHGGFSRQSSSRHQGMEEGGSPQGNIGQNSAAFGHEVEASGWKCPVGTLTVRHKSWPQAPSNTTEARIWSPS